MTRTAVVEVVLKEALEKLASGRHLEREEARRAALDILSGEVPESLIGGLLVALKCNGETAEEIAGFAQGMREVKVAISPRAGMLVDTCGTGGDGKGTFNISTAAGIIAAACGVPVAKHGNRGVSSGCGSADVFEALGVDIQMAPERVSECIERVGMGFMFAPGFHPATKRVMGARKALGVPTIFNILGPLTNPAGARAQVVGVNRRELVGLMGRVLVELGCERGFVLHGTDGMDEFTLSARTLVCEVDSGSVSEYELAPEDLGLSRCAASELTGGSAGENAAIVREVLAGRGGPRLDVCVANAGFAVLAGGEAGSLQDGVRAARLAVETGGAARVLDRLVEFSRNGGNGVS